MDLAILAAIKDEHAATMHAVQQAQARALHVGALLLRVRQALGLGVWDHWLANDCPIPAGAAKRYAREAQRLE